MYSQEKILRILFEKREQTFLTAITKIKNSLSKHKFDFQGIFLFVFRAILSV